MLTGIILLILSLLAAIGVGGAILQIGQSRRPIAPGEALAVAVIGAAQIASYFYLSTQL